MNKRKKNFAAKRSKERRNKPLTQAQQRTYMLNYIKHMRSYTQQQLRGYSFDEIKALFETTMRRIVAEEELSQQGSKRQKTNEVSGSYIQSLTGRFTLKNLENIKGSLGLVELNRLFEPDTDDELWKLQKYMHDLLTWRLYDTCGVHHVSIKKGKDIFMLVEKKYPLSRGVLTLMLVNKLLVDQSSEVGNELLRKIFIQAERPRQ
ncbi:hypothetical protein Tco_1429741 [Tanacetum coccineum]